MTGANERHKKTLFKSREVYQQIVDSRRRGNIYAMQLWQHWKLGMSLQAEELF